MPQALPQEEQQENTPYGPGYRVYFVKRGKTVVILLSGGDKGSHNKDIKKAIAMAKEVT